MYMNTLYIYLLFSKCPSLSVNNICLILTYCKTFYVALNLINILNEANPTDVILNALALEFVFTLDEVFANAVWWDPGRRWLKAGVMEVFIQSSFQFRALQSSRLFSDLYDIDEKLVEKVCDGDDSLLYDVRVSRDDRSNIEFMNHSDKFQFYCQRKATEMSADNFLEFTKYSHVFGSLEQFLEGCISTILHTFRFKPTYEGFGVFYRLQYYQTWSRWKKVLFLGTIPNIDGKISSTFDKMLAFHLLIFLLQ